MSENWEDPFAEREKLPSVSFRDAVKGDSFTGRVTQRAERVQSRDYDTGELLTFEDGSPKWSVVIQMDVDGTLSNLWFPIMRKAEQSLFNAVMEAQRKAGQIIDVGGTLTVTLVGEKQGANPKRAPRKLYAATYVPPGPVDVFAADDEPPF